MAARFCKIACSHAFRRLGRLTLPVTEADASQRLAGSGFSRTFDNFQLSVTELARQFSTFSSPEASFWAARKPWSSSLWYQDGHSAFPVSSHCCGSSSEWRRCLRTEGLREVAVKHLEGELKGVMVVALDRPHAKNALGRALLEQLQGAIEGIDRNPRVRAVILHSNVPKVFCAGADLKERKEMTQDEVQQFVRQLGAAFKEIEDLRVPTIAALEGHALGGGLELALSCDLRVGGQNTRLGLPETGLAIIPGAGGTQRLPRLVGVSKAKELIFTGRILDAQEAHRIGLLNHLVGPREAYDKAVELAAEILKKGPVAVQAAKVAIDRGIEASLEDGLHIEHECYAETLSTRDRLEGLAAFAEKRAPVYIGE